VLILPTIKPNVVFTSLFTQIAKILASSDGQLEISCGLHVARGPWVGQTCFSA